MTRKQRLTSTYLVLVPALAILFVIDISIGSIHLTFNEILKVLLHPDSSSSASALIWQLRLPRTITAIFAGAALALSGAQMQAIFKNPLADPHILGLSAGAGTGVATFTYLAAGSGIGASIGSASAAAIGSAIAGIVILLAASRIRRTSGLLITGVMLGFIFSSLTSIIGFRTDEIGVKMFWSWSAGSFSGNSTSGTVIMGFALILGSLIALYCHKGLNLIIFGDDFAQASGLNTKKTRAISMLGCCILTGSATAFCGPIGFVGIIAPHIARWASGKSAMNEVLPLSILTGAVICLAGDIVSQMWEKPLPVGSTIALLGIPIILWIIKDN